MIFSDGKSVSTPKDGFKRLDTVKYTNLSQRFCFKAKNDYTKQFAHIYANRLNSMRDLLTEKAIEKWGKQ